MEEFLTIEDATHYDTTIQTARFLTAEEKARYNPDRADHIMTTTKDDIIALPYITWRDMPKKKAEGEFSGCGNRVFIISEAEKEAYIKLNNDREAAKKAEEKAEAIAFLKERIKEIEAQTDIPTAKEAKRRMKAYNDLYNEGGEGYVPHIYSIDDYNRYKARLAQLEAE